LAKFWTSVRCICLARSGEASLSEVHPEVSFAELAGESLFWARDIWRGAPLRRLFLGGAEITLADELGEADCVLAFRRFAKSFQSVAQAPTDEGEPS